MTDAEICTRLIQSSNSNQLVPDDFFCGLTNSIHLLNPFHLILGLELFCDALAGGVLLVHPRD